MNKNKEKRKGEKRYLSMKVMKRKKNSVTNVCLTVIKE
jgi:hypothetical protein